MFRAMLVAVAAIALGGCAASGQETKVKGCYHAAEAAEREIGFCQAVRVGDTLYVSGNVGNGPMPEAIRSTYERLKKTLEANGLDFRNVVKENVYATDLDAFIRYKDMRREYYGNDYPAATWVQVQRLYVPSLVLEVEVTARFP